jgi:hypothetical protein
MGNVEMDAGGEMFSPVGRIYGVRGHFGGSIRGLDT